MDESHARAVNAGAATIVEAKWTEDGRPEFYAGDFKELEARSRGPDVLTAQEEAMAEDAKADGNVHFKAGRITDALQAYHRALEVFSDRCGGPEQRVLKSVLCANRAECLLRLEKWEAAIKSCALALTLDPTNAKARFRRARAPPRVAWPRRARTLPATSTARRSSRRAPASCAR